MRPIDADRLKFVLEKNFGHTGGASVLEQLIDEQPTIQHEKAQLSQQGTTSDLISRQAAIDIVVFECGKWTGLAKEISKQLKQLPSAQPELTDDQAIAHLQSSGWMQRHDKEMYESGLKEQLADDSDSYDSLLPSAQPERQSGEWIYNSPVTMKCDQCGLVIKDWDWHRFKFCPNCDCDMRGEQE